MNMKNLIIIKRKNNKETSILKILSVFRDLDIINSLEEISNYMKNYETEDQISIECEKENLERVKKDLQVENVLFSIK